MLSISSLMYFLDIPYPYCEKCSFSASNVQLLPLISRCFVQAKLPARGTEKTASLFSFSFKVSTLA